MIVTFRPTINNTSDVTACYLNFLRCVTAIATAAAGTTTLTVNPYTASNTIDTTKNCIISIDANTEAGGWTTSASHNVPSSGNNTPSTYTAISSAAAFLYKADFYNASGKSTYPYKKMCFHSYNDSSTYNFYSGTSTYPSMIKADITANRGANILITFGASSSTDWTSNTFPPGSGVVSTQINNSSVQTTSWTLNQNTTSGTLANRGPGLAYTDTSVEYHMAVTADYCVIWESKVGDTYANGYFTTTTTGNGTTYWNLARYGSIYYAGLRTTQPWEDTLTNNVPWVVWQYTATDGGNASTTGPLPHNQVAASMITNNNSGVAGITPRTYVTTNNYAVSNFSGEKRNSLEDDYNATLYLNAYKMLDGPIFMTRNMGASNYTYAGERATTANMLYMPQYDTVTGTQVPGAYPIKISRCYNGDWNPGGTCRGIYKSLSMPYATMKLYWQAANQTFTIGSDTYLPFVINEDMWLVRFA